MHWKVFVKNRWDWSSLGFSLQWRFMKPPFAMSFDDDEKEFGKKRKTTAMPKCSSKRGDKIVEITMNFSREKNCRNWKTVFVHCESSVKTIFAKLNFSRQKIVWFIVTFCRIWPRRKARVIFTTAPNLLLDAVSNLFCKPTIWQNTTPCLSFFAPYAKSYPPNISRIHAHFFFTFWSMNFYKMTSLHSGQNMLKNSKIWNSKLIGIDYNFSLNAIYQFWLYANNIKLTNVSIQCAIFHSILQLAPSRKKYNLNDKW